MPNCSRPRPYHQYWGRKCSAEHWGRAPPGSSPAGPFLFPPPFLCWAVPSASGPSYHLAPTPPSSFPSLTKQHPPSFLPWELPQLQRRGHHLTFCFALTNTCHLLVNLSPEGSPWPVTGHVLTRSPGPSPRKGLPSQNCQKQDVGSLSSAGTQTLLPG